jgi:beta-phosphoglucomutase-like phosphatase (HAD superfamily)
MTPPVLPLLSAIRACLFDLERMLIDAATLHVEVWKDPFGDFVPRRATREDGPFVPFDLIKDDDEYIDGKRRFDGVRSFFCPRGIELPEGRHDDPPAGVAAGRSGRFGMVVGVDRVGEADALRAYGADVVVSDLAELFERA